MAHNPRSADRMAHRMAAQVNYQSLRHAATWNSDTCKSEVCELHPVSGLATQRILQCVKQSKQCVCILKHAALCITKTHRHAACTTDIPSVSQVFELPGCDHRGASSDKRMLTILQTILGLIPPENAELLRQQQHERDQEAEAGAAQWGRTGAIPPHLHSVFPSSPSLAKLLL